MRVSAMVRLACGIGLALGLMVGVAGPAGAGGSGGSSGGSGFDQGWQRTGHHHGHPSGPTVCTGTATAPGVLAGTYRGDVKISGVCQVNGGAAVVKGDLILLPGSALNATFATNQVSGSGTSSLLVRGDVKVEDGAVLAMGCEPNFSPCTDDPAAATGGTLTGSNTVEGDLHAHDALAVIVHASTIGGSILQLGGGGGASCDVPTTGIFALMQSPVFSDYEDNTVDGNLGVGDLETCWLGALRNDVHRSMAVVGSTFGDPDANETVSNTVQRNLYCGANSPAVQFGDSMGTPNQVGGKAFGECDFSVEQPNPAPSGPLTPISVPLA